MDVGHPRRFCPGSPAGTIISTPSYEVKVGARPFVGPCSSHNGSPLRLPVHSLSMPTRIGHPRPGTGCSRELSRRQYTEKSLVRGEVPKPGRSTKLPQDGTRIAFLPEC